MINISNTVRIYERSLATTPLPLPSAVTVKVICVADDTSVKYGKISVSELSELFEYTQSDDVSVSRMVTSNDIYSLGICLLLHRAIMR